MNQSSLGIQGVLFCFVLDLREHKRGGEGEAGSLPSGEPGVGLHPGTLRSPPEPKPRIGRITNCTTQAPCKV